MNEYMGDVIAEIWHVIDNMRAEITALQDESKTLRAELALLSNAHGNVAKDVHALKPRAGRTTLGAALADKMGRHEARFGSYHCEETGEVGETARAQGDQRGIEGIEFVPPVPVASFFNSSEAVRRDNEEGRN